MPVASRNDGRPGKPPGRREGAGLIVICILLVFCITHRSRTFANVRKSQTIKQLEKNGVSVAARIQHVVRPNEHNRFYLEAKAARSGHYIDLDGKQHLAEQDDPAIIGERA